MTTTKKTAQTNGTVEVTPEAQLEAEIAQLEAEIQQKRDRLLALRLQRDAQRQAKAER